MNRYISAINGRLSLRPPQRQSLEILAEVVDSISPSKERDLASALETIRELYPSVVSFEERDFPSLCFAIATGVGKTRLMGAFISYLHLAKGFKNFFVLAPNLTIYNKLIADFTPGHPKYVFQGISEFAVNAPEIITGDNYDVGRATRRQLDIFGKHEGVHINIFNISKINSEVRGGNAPRIKRLSEFIGDSYFNYLASLDDLVLVMDESHRYRASAGVRALNELKPILGLELTATPQVETGAQAKPFQNVIYSYPLSSAMTDGFVKEPAVATRENFDASQYSEEQLERIKLEDGIRIHENTKVELATYARQRGLPLVKPFMLVVARDTDHANALIATIESEQFFEGRYRGRVIPIHSGLRGEEKDENVASLLAVENPDEPTEIVVHVNMLKEGWDVTNLYTIVPLRAADSRTLVEQSIGRGLRLPYGKRTGVAAVDRLTIVAHDKFQAIIDEANRPGSVLRMGVVLMERDIPPVRKETVVVPSVLEQQIAAAESKGDGAGLTSQQTRIFATEEERKIAQTTIDVIRRYERLPASSGLKTVEIQAQIAREVEAVYNVGQGTLDGVTVRPDITKVVSKAVDLFIERTIDLPRIVVLPLDEETGGFADFDLDPGDLRLHPVDQEILIHHLHSNDREKLDSGALGQSERQLEDYLVAALIDYDDVSYDNHADLLYKLSGQMVDHLRSYLPDDNAVLNVIIYHKQRLAEVIHTQMQDHWERPAATKYEVKVSKGFTTLRPNHYATMPGDTVNFRAPVDEKRYIRGMLFEGFQRCLYAKQKFDSDSERRFAMLLEDDTSVLKWFKPAKTQFQIHYRNDQAYEPDFVVETADAKYLCEPKRASEMNSEEVVEKARAAVLWCQHATEHARAEGGKPWHYLLIPHDAITASATLQGLAAAYCRSAVAEVT